MPDAAPGFRPNWRSATGHVLRTALGVALALAGSAWWGTRKNHEREMSDLHVALEATRTNERRIRQAIFEDSISYAIDTRLRNWLNGAVELPSDSIVTLFAMGAWWSDAKPITGPFIMLVQTGDINLIRDSQLRADIPTYLGEIESRMEELRETDQASVNSGGKPSSIPEFQRYGLHRTPGNAIRLRASEELMRYVYDKTFWLRNTLSFYRIMLRETTKLRLALEQYLGEPPVPLPQPRLLRDSF